MAANDDAAFWQRLHAVDQITRMARDQRSWAHPLTSPANAGLLLDILYPGRIPEPLLIDPFVAAIVSHLPDEVSNHKPGLVYRSPCGNGYGCCRRLYLANRVRGTIFQESEMASV